MSMVNTRTKPIPIKATSSSVKKSSSTSSPQSSSSASPQTSSSSSNESPATTIQTLVRPSSSRTAFSNAQNARDVCQTTRSTKSATDVPSSSSLKSGTTATTHSLSAQNSFRYGNSSEPLSKTDAMDAAAPLTVTNNSTQLHYHISSDILDDLASRFIINVPDDERNNLIRICFQIELAHWFYLDFFCINDEKKCGMKQFAMSLFHHIPFLRVHLAAIDKILENWKQYKLTVPTYGAILLSEDLNYVLLVQSYWAKSSWGFPKGKVNENEDPIHCAAREVYEETGYDITHLIVCSDYIESIINDQYTRLYLVRNVPLKTLFMPRTRKEIKCCEWFSIDSLPTSKNDANVKQNLGINANSFFMIMPFIKRLKKWVSDKRLGNTDASSSQFHCNKSKFNGQFSSNNAINNAIAANSRKSDANKLPLKTTPTAATANLTSGNQPTVLGLTYQNSANNGSKPSTSNKRQRHKSMGDLDGMVKSNQVINGLPSNLRQVNPVKVHTNSTSTFNSVFNDFQGSSMAGTNCDSYEHREKTLKQNIRRQKSTNNSGFWKIMETTAFTSVGVTSTSVSVGSNKTTEAKTTTSAAITTYHYDNVKENVDFTKQLHPKSPKLNNQSNGGIYYNYCNSGSNKKADDVQSNSKRSVSSGNQKENVTKKKSTQESASKPISLLKRTKSIETDSLEFITAATDKSVISNVQATQPPPIESTDSPKKALANLKSSPNFNSWRTFSFAERCIANVFC